MHQLTAAVSVVLDGVRLQLAIEERARCSKLSAACHQLAGALGRGGGAVRMIYFLLFIVFVVVVVITKD